MNVDNSSNRRMTIVTAVLTALIVSLTTVLLTKLLDSAFPSSFVLKEKSDSINGALMYSIGYYARSDGRQFLGIVTQYPTWYYSMSIGNTSNKHTGTISITIDFPEKMKEIWALLGSRRVKVRNTNTIHFQAPQLTSRQGLTFSVRIASLDLPDINKMQITVTSSAGEFKKVPPQHYNSVFRSAKK